MTTQEQATVDTLAKALSAEELEALRTVSRGYSIDSGVWIELEERGLVGVKYGQNFVDTDFLTSLGTAVLAAANALPTSDTAQGAGVDDTQLRNDLFKRVQDTLEKVTTDFRNYTNLAELQILSRDVELATLQGVQQIAVDNYNAIWLMVRGNKVGEWDYPAQVTRYAGYQAEELAKAQAENATLRTRLQAAEAALMPFAEVLSDYRLHRSNSAYESDLESFVDEFYSTSAIKAMMSEFYAAFEAAAQPEAFTPVPVDEVYELGMG